MMAMRKDGKMEQLELIDLPCDQCLCFSCRLVVSIWERKKKILDDFRLEYPEYTNIEYHGFYIKAEKKR